ncbi:MAG TPA: ABC transporter permease [Solirubrobacter sp.]|nr:ABC transporter permease [Solirubrobacter sp.]
MSTALAGTRRLVRFTLRRDRVRLTVWVLAIVVTVLGSVATFSSTYPTAADRQARADVLQSNAAASLFVGPGYGTDHYTFGAMTANEMLPLTALVVALMNIFLIVRHTRAEEEEERAELIRATRVGRLAIPSAALTELIGANVAIAVLLTFGLPASLEGLSAAGSLAFACGVAGVGLVFAGVALVAAQLTVSARGALGLSSLVMAVLYLERALADMGDSGLAWLSPFGWASNLRAYVDERWWPLLLFAALTAALVAVAFRIAAHRDLGAGMIAERPGRPHASARLRSPLALALRLQRTSLVAWALSLLAFGAVYGSIAPDAAHLAADVVKLKDYYARIGHAAVVDQFVSFAIYLCAVVAAGFAIQVATRPRAEETAGRTEPLLATPVGRVRWLGAQLAVSLGGGVLVLLGIGLGMGVSYALADGDAGHVLPSVGAALTYAPALWVFTGLAALLFGLLPRATTWAWAGLGVVGFLALLGPLLQLPDWIYDVSPFEHVPRMPADAFSAAPLLVLTAVAAALLALGAWGFRRRDLG